MSNEFGLSPKILICPSDERQSADIFSNIVSNTNLSYFVGVSSDDYYPQSILSGDRNLAPGTVPGKDYGFSPKTGLGNDIAIQTNSKFDPICWSQRIHTWNSLGAGNILLGDGSAQQASSAGFRINWQPNGGRPQIGPRVMFPGRLRFASSFRKSESPGCNRTKQLSTLQRRQSNCSCAGFPLRGNRLHAANQSGT